MKVILVRMLLFCFFVTQLYAMVNPLLQPFHLLESYQTVALFVIDTVNDEEKVVTLSLQRVLRGEGDPLKKLTFGLTTQTLRKLLLPW